MWRLGLGRWRERSWGPRPSPARVRQPSLALRQPDLHLILVQRLQPDDVGRLASVPKHVAVAAMVMVRSLVARDLRSGGLRPVRAHLELRRSVARPLPGRRRLPELRQPTPRSGRSIGSVLPASCSERWRSGSVRDVRPRQGSRGTEAGRVSACREIKEIGLSRRPP